MLKIEQTYEQIIGYLKGILTNRQGHQLEKEMMRDTFDEEAFEGLNQLSASEFEADMSTLKSRLARRTEKSAKRITFIFLRVAAAIVILIGIGSILYLIF